MVDPAEVVVASVLEVLLPLLPLLPLLLHAVSTAAAASSAAHLVDRQRSLPVVSHGLLWNASLR